MIELTPIGVISSPFKSADDAPRQGRELEGCSTICIYPRFQDGLGEMIGISHIWVLYWMDQAKRDVLFSRRPEWIEERPVFTIRSPERPNPIAISVGRIMSIKKGVIIVCGIEALHGSPVLDIKPYIPGLDCVPGAEYSTLTHHNETFDRSREPE